MTTTNNDLPNHKLSKNLSENRRGLAHFAEPSEQNVPVPLPSGGFRIGSKKTTLTEYRDQSSGRWRIALFGIFSTFVLGHGAAFGTEYIGFSADIDGNGSLDRGAILRHLTTGEARVKIDFMQRGRPIRVESYDLGGVKYDRKNQRWLLGDVDGDGQTDIVLVYGIKGRARAVVFQYKLEFRPLKRQDFAGFWSSQKWSIKDVNLDGRMDLVNRYKTKRGTREWVHYGKADGSFEYKSLLRTIH